MCNNACIDFGVRHLEERQIKGLKVLEVGARDVNGSLRGYVEMFKPASYLGVDLFPGPGVDYLCSVELIVDALGKEAFDLVLCTEMLEHVRDWRLAVTNLKIVCYIGGTILITTRSKGFPIHDFPSDYWRFEVDDMKYIFSDCDDVVIEQDKTVYKSSISGELICMPGVFVRATRTEKLLDLKDYEVQQV
jgi:SAM-dependent methyltransferase